jgi:hypothetical protein
MKERLTFSSKRPRWVLLPAVAAIGVLAGLTNAFAADQQATDDEMDYAISQRAASGGYSGARAEVPYGGTVYAPRHHHHHR